MDILKANIHDKGTTNFVCSENKRENRSLPNYNRVADKTNY